MSQEKVNQKKEDKKNRRSTLRKKKVEYVISIVCASIIAIAIVGWIGYSAYNKATAVSAEDKTYEYNEVSTDALQDYLSSLYSE